ncbi:MAG: hypothetical protein M3M99_02545 [Actinomycetota bacterium]|nr:hypothetical protein [Actinomycetota bacterium]
MLLARIICSDPGCEEGFEIAVETLIELEGFVCECGYGYVLESISELGEDGAEVLSIATRRPGVLAARRAA